MRSVVLSLICLCCCASEAAPTWPDLPDPIGIGPRLVTIEWLRDHGVRVPAGLLDAQIVELYRNSTATPKDVTEAETTAELAERLRYLLRSVHKIDAPQSATINELGDLYRRAEAQAREEEMVAARAIAERMPEPVADKDDRATVQTPTKPKEPRPAPVAIDVKTNELSHIEVIYSLKTYAVYRFTDGSATIVTDDWRGERNTRTTSKAPVAPIKDDGWNNCAPGFQCTALYRNGQLLFENRSDSEAVLTVSIGGARYASVVPARSRRIGPGPETWNPIEQRASIASSQPTWSTHPSGVRVVTIGEP